MEVSDAQRVRIAVALTALRHKPEEQTFEAYALDLQMHFPLECETHSLFDVASEWRTRAMGLEAKLREVEDKHRDDCIELIALRSVSENIDTSSPCALSTEPPPNGKKKSRKRPKPPLENTTDRKGAISQDICGEPINGFHGSGSLFSALHILDALTATHSDKPSASDLETLFAATSRAIDKLAEVFSAIVHPESNKTSSCAISSMSTMLSRLLTVVLPIFGKSNKKRARKATAKDFAEALLGQLLSTLLLPALHSFSTLSRRHVSALLHPSTQSVSDSHPTICDLRPAILDLLRTALFSFQEVMSAAPPTSTLQSNLQAVQRSLTLEATRELDNLYPPEADSPNDVGPALCAASPPSLSSSASTHSQPQPQSSIPLSQHSRSAEREQRLMQLARRDALWYVCSVAHLTIPGTVAAPASLSNGAPPARRLDADVLLCEGVWRVLGALLRRAAHAVGDHASECGSGHGLENDGAGVGEPGREVLGRSFCGADWRSVTRRDRGSFCEAEREMLMALAERVWLYMSDVPGLD